MYEKVLGELIGLCRWLDVATFLSKYLFLKTFLLYDIDMNGTHERELPKIKSRYFVVP